MARRGSFCISMTAVAVALAAFLGPLPTAGAQSVAAVGLVKDIMPGAESSGVSLLTVANGTLFFFAQDEGTVFWNLYRSDGTAAGTTSIREFGAYFEMTSVGSSVHFSAYDTSGSGGGIWKSDGTLAGTVLVKNFSGILPSQLTDVAGTLFFTVFDLSGGYQLWKSNGTTAGTVLVKTISSVGTFPHSLTALGTRLVFVADSGGGEEPWVSDGTAAGTFQLKNVNPGSDGSFPSYLTAVGAKLFFSALDATNGQELWMTDGTTAGTVLVKDINPGAPDSTPEELVAFGDRVLFRAFTAAAGTELMISDGTNAGTGLLKDVRPGVDSSSPAHLTNAGTVVYFHGFTGAATPELWKTDGTAGGTVKVANLPAETDPFETGARAGVRGVYAFATEGATTGLEPWYSNGVAAGTGLARDVYAGVAGSEPEEYAVAVAPAPGAPDPAAPTLVARVFFTADDGVNGRELWRYDITEDVTPGPPVLIPPASALVVGASNTLTGSRITAGTVVKLFVATASGPVSYGPFPATATTSGSLTFAIPTSVALGNGFVAIQAVATDAGFLESNVVGALLYGDAADGIPTILTVNGQALAAPDLSIGLAHADTVVGKGATVTIAGTGFANPLVNLFTASGNVGPLTPLAGGTATSIQVVVPAGAPTGPGNFQVVNRPSFTPSNAVASILGARPGITSVSVAGSTITINGAGFSVLSVINLFNVQGGGVVNLGGLTGSTSKVPLTFVNDTRLTFTRPVAAVAGPAFVEVLNPPYTPYSSSGNDPEGAFSFPAGAPLLTWAVPAARPDGPAADAGEPVRWTRITAGAATAADATGTGAHRGVRSTQALLGDGALAWTVPAGAGDAAIGLNHDDRDGSLGDLDFALRVAERTGELLVYEQGRRVLAAGRVMAGDRLEVRVRAGTVEYWRNDAPVWTSTRAPRFPLVVDASLGRAGAGLPRARVTGRLGEVVEWAVGAGTRRASLSVAAGAPLTTRGHRRITSGALEAGLGAGATVGLGAGAGPDYAIERRGGILLVHHAGVARGGWPVAGEVRVRVEIAADGAVRYWAAGELLDVGRREDRGPLVPAARLASGARVDAAVLEGQP
jgi:ELWxxDGT repeat protein